MPDKKFGKQTSLATVIDGTEDADAVGGISGKKSVSRRHKAAYSGGLVLEPKKGKTILFLL